MLNDGRSPQRPMIRKVLERRPRATQYGLDWGSGEHGSVAVKSREFF